MLLIGLAVAYGRTRLGIETALSFRYQINSAILLVLIYISMQDLFFKGNSKKTPSGAVFDPIHFSLSFLFGEGVLGSNAKRHKNVSQ